MCKTIGEMNAQELTEACDNIKAARTAWEASDQIVPFPDYWLGWSAATVLINERKVREDDQRRYTDHLAEVQHNTLVEMLQCEIAKRDAKINKLLQPTLKGEAFKKLRLENERLRKGLQSISDHSIDSGTYAQLVLDGVL